MRQTWQRCVKKQAALLGRMQLMRAVLLGRASASSGSSCGQSSFFQPSFFQPSFFQPSFFQTCFQLSLGQSSFFQSFFQSCFASCSFFQVFQYDSFFQTASGPSTPTASGWLRASGLLGAASGWLAGWDQLLDGWEDD